MKILFYGHAGIKIEDRITLLIDPWLNDNPLATMKADEVTKADYIIATHNHADHVDVRVHQREVDEEYLDDGAHPGDGGANGGADDAGFGDGRVDAALRSEFGKQAVGDLVGAAAFGDTHADAEDALVAGHLLVQGLVQAISQQQSP